MNNQLRVAYQLFCRDMVVFRKGFVGTLVNSLMWPIISAIMFGFVLPHFGGANASQNFGSFMIAGSLMALAIINALSRATDIIVDIQHQKLINFERTLPLSFSMLILQKIVTIAVMSLFYSVVILVVAKLILWDSFSLSTVSWPWLIIVLVWANLFYAAFALMVSGWIPTASKMENVWMRLYMPALWFGSYMNRWYEFYKMLPSVALFMLLNPVTYTMDGLRATMFGQEGYISLWIVLGMLTLQFVLASRVGIYLMKKRLNAI